MNQANSPEKDDIQRSSHFIRDASNFPEENSEKTTSRKISTTSMDMVATQKKAEINDEIYMESASIYRSSEKQNRTTSKKPKDQTVGERAEVEYIKPMLILMELFGRSILQAKRTCSSIWCIIYLRNGI